MPASRLADFCDNPQHALRMLYNQVRSFAAAMKWGQIFFRMCHAPSAM
jgi:hypothetical protein